MDPDIESGSRPHLSELIQARSPEIFRIHQDSERAGGLEVEEQWLREARHIGGILNVDDKDFPSFTLLFGKVDRLRLDRIENAFDDPADLAVPDEGVNGSGEIRLSITFPCEVLLPGCTIRGRYGSRLEGERRRLQDHPVTLRCTVIPNT